MPREDDLRNEKTALWRLGLGCWFWGVCVTNFCSFVAFLMSEKRPNWAPSTDFKPSSHSHGHLLALYFDWLLFPLSKVQGWKIRCRMRLELFGFGAAVKRFWGHFRNHTDAALKTHFSQFVHLLWVSSWSGLSKAQETDLHLLKCIMWSWEKEQKQKSTETETFPELQSDCWTRLWNDAGQMILHPFDSESHSEQDALFKNNWICPGTAFSRDDMITPRINSEPADIQVKATQNLLNTPRAKSEVTSEWGVDVF